MGSEGEASRVGNGLRDDAWTCCFCYGQVPEGTTVHLTVSVPGDDARQSLMAHAGCLAEVVDPRIPLLSEL